MAMLEATSTWQETAALATAELWQPYETAYLTADASVSLAALNAETVSGVAVPHPATLRFEAGAVVRYRAQRGACQIWREPTT